MEKCFLVFSKEDIFDFVLLKSDFTCTCNRVSFSFFNSEKFRNSFWRMFCLS